MDNLLEYMVLVGATGFFGSVMIEWLDRKTDRMVRNPPKPQNI